MRTRILFSNLPFLALFLAFAPTALASSTWYVDALNGSDSNNCKSPQHACQTIGHAISLAHAGDSIVVAAATYTENLTIGTSLKIVGSGAATTIIDGGHKGTVVTISNTTAHVRLSKLTMSNGLAQSGGGVTNSGTLTVIHSTLSGNEAFSQCYRDCTAKGGGIYNSGTLMVIDSIFSGNEASVHCTDNCFASGGAIENEGTLTISNSTLSGNSTLGSCGQCAIRGGGIYTAGSTVINNTTFSLNAVSIQCKNLCFPDGGGIYTAGRVTINNSTFSGNSAVRQGGGIEDEGTLTISNSTLKGNNALSGGGIHNDNFSATTTLQNSIVANSPSGGNCAGTMTSNGYNLSSDNTCNFNNTGDLNNTNPKLGQLGNYGGPTQTIPLLSGSPAIDGGNPSGCTDGHGHLLKTDQRGKPRPDKEDTGGCDMGAYERQSD